MVQVALDPHTEGALKVIEFYDTLVEHAATLEACVRASGSLSRCVAGLRDHDSTWSIRFNEMGFPAEGDPSPSMTQVVRVETSVVGEVWLERPGEPGDLDELILERFARAAGALWRRNTPVRSVASRVQSLLLTDLTPEDREKMLWRLGFDLSRPLNLMAVQPDDVLTLATELTRVRDAVAQAGPDPQPAVCAAIGSVGAIIAQPVSQSEDTSLRALPEDCRARIGLRRDCQVADLPDAWQKANAALRFGRVLGFGPVVDHHELGALELLEGITSGAVARNDDVRRLDELAASRNGDQALRTLEAFLIHDSVRKAAASMFVHQSTLQYRLAQLELALGFSLTSQKGRLRAAVAVTTWRLTRT